MDRQQEVSSKLAVLLHADVADSTALVREDEARAHRRIRNTFERFAEIIAAHDGAAREVRGDALVAEFSRASDALSAAWSFQQGNRVAASECEDCAWQRLRIGIAAGEVVIADGTVTGEGIVLAQRLEQLAGDHEEAQKQARRLADFSPDFVPSLLNGGLALYKHQEHIALLLQGLREAGLGD